MMLQDQVIEELQEGLAVEISRAEYVDGHQLHIVFSDGNEQMVDFEPFLSNSLNPMINKYRDVSMFRDFRLEYGDLVWGDYDLCFPIADLYENRVQ